ncbi:uncharacterized protein UMAG_10837 [Mycosarcoma maydis]|uniref:Calcineurin-like phosphoesterase domain-containing protein n=1 Tax=Mycosarcoma maydis TaxID=5270 RepID=A0A0D1DX00_MYCMD|nr:uncharacterized protein UMAG_10837 [Ustilago maydis 521]KIS68749.1 hypothetical protein UMAG_10837 [Ustilago maydis 521]|eukprot:XP_011389821.1 hypothetical protein UMAG_10837 [Ustilago maydis 521]
MMSISAAMRLVIHGFIAMGLYSGYRYYSWRDISSSTSLTTTGSHTHGSLGPGASLADGRTAISRRTVAVADLHGDLDHALNVLSMASIVSRTRSADHAYTWIGGHDTLVSTGDIVDRGDDTIALYRLFVSLRQQARLAGGEVKNCLGNHEVMNAIGDWRYVTKADVESFGGVQARRHAMSDQGWIGQEWLHNYNVTHTISLLPETHPALPPNYTPPRVSFVHGGITPQYAALGIDFINTVGHSLLLKGLSSQPNSWLPPNTTSDEQALWSEHGPLWYRGYATDRLSHACANAEKATKSLAVNQLVMGHTPHFDGFVTRCNNTILLIDTGISRAYGGQQSALIIDFDLIPIDKVRPDGTKLWIQKQSLTALYKARPPKILSQTQSDSWH